MKPELNLIKVNWSAPAHVHAFSTTRQAGYSAGAYQGLNLGVHVADNPTLVEKNRALLSHTLSLTAPRVALSTELRLSAGWNHLPYLRPESWPLSTGLPSLAYLTGDFIKSQSSFATFCSAAEPLQTIGSSTCSLPSPLSECLIRA